jgi:hypothetical protein
MKQLSRKLLFLSQAMCSNPATISYYFTAGKVDDVKQNTILPWQKKYVRRAAIRTKMPMVRVTAVARNPRNRNSNPAPQRRGFG